MADAPTALRHQEPGKMDDAALAQEAQAHVAKAPAVQLIAEILHKIRVTAAPWWTPTFAREAWTATERMVWLKERPDLRQKITTGLTGLAPKAARNKSAEFQASLIDSVIEDADVTVAQFEEAFDVTEFAIYGPIVEVWQKFRERFPWDQDTAPNQEFMAWLFEQLLSSQSSLGGNSRKPILTSLQLRTTIPGKLWHTRIPLEVRVAIDDLRFQREKAKPGDPFHAIHDLSIATPSIITANIPLRELARVIDVAERALGFPASSATGRGAGSAGGPASIAQPATKGGGSAEASGGGGASHATSAGGGPSAAQAAGGAGAGEKAGASASGGSATTGKGGGASAATQNAAARPTPAPTGKAEGASDGPSTQRPGPPAEEDFAFDDDPDETAAESEKARRRQGQATPSGKR